jgi:hypothetical protein
VKLQVPRLRYASLGMTKGRVATNPPTFVSGMERYANNDLFRSL